MASLSHLECLRGIGKSARGVKFALKSVSLSAKFLAFESVGLGSSKRGLLLDSDYLRDEGSETWLPSAEWVSASKPAPKLKIVKAAAPKAAPATKKAKKAA